ncbi:uncharacterized protein LOC125501951 [Athalia rosae]|uniref:uncharacterized protein LOC125501951 n=1 Tax=Athalia rosae TaxID=37344 RepID=UPI002033A45F|nr:uncharacterized protein LOC125501951 [Athalia rosae]
MLKLHGIPTDYNYTFKSQITWLLGIFVSIICIISLDTAISDIKFYGTIPKICLLIHVMYTTVFQFVTDLTFNNFLRYLRNRLQCVNKLIPNILFKRHPQLINAANSEKIQVYLITDIREIHYSICSMASEYNTTIGIQILLSMTNSFLNSLSQLFKLYVMFVLMDSCPYNSTGALHSYCFLHKLIRAMPLVLFSTKIFLTIHTCVATSYEANRTGQLLAELQIATTNGHEKFRREIDIFLLQLIQNPLRFTAYEFFVLDFTTIHRMIGTVTTLLLLQVQMDDIHE